MSNSSKIVVGGSIITIAAAGVILYLSKKCKDLTEDALSRLINIQFTLNQCNKEIASGNAEIADAGKILRRLVHDSASKNVEAKKV